MKLPDLILHLLKGYRPLWHHFQELHEYQQNKPRHIYSMNGTNRNQEKLQYTSSYSQNCYSILLLSMTTAVAVALFNN